MYKTIVSATTVLFALSAVVGCANAASPNNSSQASVVSQGQSSQPNMGRVGRPDRPNRKQPPISPIEELSPEAKNELSYLTEEEKVAHDLYSLAYETYGLRVFRNIARSETQHEKTLQRVLATYAIPNPIVDTTRGKFTNPVLQELYNALATQVKESQEYALKVGSLVEKTDITELSTAKQNAPTEVGRVLDRLIFASQRHLAAFDRWQ